MIPPGSEPLELDPYAAIRPGLSPEYAGLAGEQLTAALGSAPAVLALHRLLDPTELGAVLSVLRGRRSEGSVPINGTSIPIPVYLRTLAHLCREVAGHSDGEIPQFERLIGPGGTAPQLGSSVGRRAVNKTEDVKLIQRLLNFNLPLPNPRLAENGVLDDATIQAIETFQRVMLGVKVPDGRVDPKATTFQSLAIDKLAFLPHRCQPLSGPSVPLTAAQMNPGFLTPTDVTRNTALQDIVNRRVLGNPALKRLRFALVDLTGAGKLQSPQYAGFRDTIQGGLGSMSKVATLYSAHQLKFDLEELSRQRGITRLADLFQAARDLWNQAQQPDPAGVTPIFPGGPSGPKIELQGNLIVMDGKPVSGLPGLSLPALEKIFTAVPGAASGLTLRFIGSDQIQVDPAVPAAHVETTAVQDYIRGGAEALGEVRRLTFAERLFLEMDKSDNAAAHSNIENVGFLFTTSVLWQSDLYRPERGGGLWEASTHDKGGKRWIKPPVPKDQPHTDFISATACSIAALFTLMEQGRLVNAPSCAAMKYLLNKCKPGIHTGSPVCGCHDCGSHTRSFFADGLRGLTLDRIHSKLGVGDGLSDVAIIERTVHPSPADPAQDKTIRYVAAGFDEPLPARGAPVAPLLNALILALDQCILENNGLLSASAP